MKRVLMGAGAALLLVGSLGVGAPGAARAQAADGNTVDVPVSAGGTATNSDTNQTQTVTLNGTFHVSRFVAQDNQLYAMGALDGTLSDQNGNTVATVTDQPQQVTTEAITSSCNNLDVQVGPANIPAVESGSTWTVSINQLDLGITGAHPASGVAQFALCSLADATGGSVQLSSGNLPVSASDLARALNGLLGIIS